MIQIFGIAYLIGFVFTFVVSLFLTCFVLSLGKTTKKFNYFIPIILLSSIAWPYYLSNLIYLYSKPEEEKEEE